jgi:protein-tyrosine phosphatase
MLEEEYDDFMLEADPGPRNVTKEFEGFTLEQVKKKLRDACIAIAERNLIAN